MPSPILLSAFGLTGATVVALYLGKRQLDRSYPMISVHQLPPSSACRCLIESARTSAGSHVTPKAWGLKTSGLLASWSGARANVVHQTCWIPSFVAIQIEAPVSLVSDYGPLSRDTRQQDADNLTRNFVAAFLDARARGPDGWLLDRKVPPLSFVPGSHLFGDTAGLAAFMLGTWDARSGRCVQPSALPRGATIPGSDFPSNRPVIHAKSSTIADSAGTVMYWRFPYGVVRMSNVAASYGCPWRLMDGGFQEFIIEKISDEKVRLTYVSVECSNLHPNGQLERDFKKPPWLVYEAHVLYAQSLMLRTLWQMKKARPDEIR